MGPPPFNEADLAEGVSFLTERGLMEEVEVDGGQRAMALSSEGLKALYLMATVLATGVSRDEIASGEVAEQGPAQRVSKHARNLVNELGRLAFEPE